MRRLSNLKGLRDSRTVRNAKRSVPIRAKSIYLDMFVFRKEKDRLEMEQSRLDKQMEVINKQKETVRTRLDEVDKLMEELQEIARKGEEQARSGCVEEKDNSGENRWKTVPLGY